MITKPKGTYDLYGSEGAKFLRLQNIIINLMECYNFEYLRTPAFERCELFHRGVGETTDIVKKETYDFTDRGDRTLTLRPEGTASAVRCFIENKMHAMALPKKFWYLEPMYRYERPQKGRFREHFQFGCEIFGSFDALSDAEIISIPYTLLSNLGLTNIKVHINTLGDNKSRENYRNALVKYLEPHIDSLCSDCKERFKKNPLRILDCKVDKDSDILKNVPKITDYLEEEAKERFNKVTEYLDTLNVSYIVDSNIVRGLDYYTSTVFEIIYDENITLCGGGRYNNLIESLDGTATPAVGFGMGIERLMETLDNEGIDLDYSDYTDCYVVNVGETLKKEALELAYALRIMGFKTEMDLMDRNVKANFKHADNINARFTIIVGEDELKENCFKVKNMKTKQEELVNTNMIISYLQEKIEEIEEESYNSKSCSCHEDEDEECSCSNCTCHDNDYNF